MSLFCPRQACKEKPGPCTCEKIMGAIIVIVAIALLARHFM
jgi:hypothetical protein